MNQVVSFDRSKLAAAIYKLGKRSGNLSWAAAGFLSSVRRTREGRIKSRFQMKYKILITKKIDSSAYELKALELANSAIPSLCQWAHQGCAGIGHQLHPLKVKNVMMDKSGVFFSWCLRYVLLCILLQIRNTLQRARCHSSDRQE